MDKKVNACRCFMNIWVVHDYGFLTGSSRCLMGSKDVLKSYAGAQSSRFYCQNSRLTSHSCQ